MRIDKYLWCIRFFKTRSIATNACKKGRIRINDAMAKPSKEVFISDVVHIRKNQIDYKIEVLDLPPSRVGAKLVNLYLNDITPQENIKKLELLKHSKEHYRKKGTGRPTKKDRRDIDDFTEDFNE